MDKFLQDLLKNLRTMKENRSFQQDQVAGQTLFATQDNLLSPSCTALLFNLFSSHTDIKQNIYT
jgi:hypothetical protein